MIRYLVLLPFYILFSIFARLCAPIAVVFFSTPDKRFLRFPFRWLMTLDADLGGDVYWPQHITGSRYSTWNRIRWMLRNGGHYGSYFWFGCNVGDSRFPEFRRFIKIGNRYLELFFGWHHKGAKYGRAKYVFSIRLAKEKK